MPIWIQLGELHQRRNACVEKLSVTSVIIYTNPFQNI